MEHLAEHHLLEPQSQLHLVSPDRDIDSDGQEREWWTPPESPTERQPRSPSESSTERATLAQSESSGEPETLSPTESDTERPGRRSNPLIRKLPSVNSLREKRLRKRSKLSHISVPAISCAKSLYKGWKRPLRAVSQSQALRDLLGTSLQPNSRGCTIISLSEFRVYLPGPDGPHAYELRSLNELKSRRGHTSFYFDGILQLGSEKRYVERIRFDFLSIDGYGTDKPSINHKTCIASEASLSKNVWYKLKSPAEDYERFFRPFCWLVDLAKHFVAFLDSHLDVQLNDFRSKFKNWLYARYGNSSRFCRWISEYNGSDFRTCIVANIDFLWGQGVNVQEEHGKHSLWKQADREQLAAIKEQRNVEENSIVTPFVFRCFQKMYFASCLEMREPSPEVANAQWQRKVLFDAAISRAGSGHESRRNMKRNDASLDSRGIRPGDVVFIKSDTESKWKNAAPWWYAFVQSIDFMRNGRGKLCLIWLYAPADTTLSTKDYPFDKELFFSDHCNCPSINEPTFLDDVEGKVEVKFFRNPSQDQHNFFVRQKYISDKNDPAYASFVTLRPSHFSCSCRDSKPRNYEQEFPAKTFALVHGTKHGCLEPVAIVSYPSPSVVEVRQLLRRRRDLGDSEAKAHELVYTRNKFKIKSDWLVRECNVRFYAASEVRSRKVPAPYCYNGVGNCWIITGVLSADHKIEAIQRPYPDVVQGFDPEEQSSRCTLQGLGLFCGGGSFDRGLEDGRGVHFKYAADMNNSALHTYLANRKNGSTNGLFRGNVCDLLARTLRGEKHHLIPAVGEVHCTCGGNPCVSFSLLQNDRFSESSLKNASLVAVLASFVDVLRPAYGLFENVFGMGHRLGKDRNESVLSQLLCCFVAMGYQVSLFNVDAWSHEAPQSRQRLFTSITAPGLPPVKMPPPTHSHPSGTPDRAIGCLSNGESFGCRRFDETPFTFISASEATADLPSISEGAVNVCVPFPDHQLVGTKRSRGRLVMRKILRFPYGSSYRTSDQSGVIPNSIKAGYRTESRLWNSEYNSAFRRIHPNKPFTTIVTRPTPDCAKNGAFLHWDEPRAITKMEARRAQTFPDDEVIIGSAAEQFKIIGNSVARTVAVALGVELQKAVAACPPNHPLLTSSAVSCQTSAATANLGDEMTLNGAASVVATEPVVRINGAARPQHQQPKHHAADATDSFRQTISNDMTLTVATEPVVRISRPAPPQQQRPKQDNQWHGTKLAFSSTAPPAKDGLDVAVRV